jgi:hypothetical protein
MTVDIRKHLLSFPFESPTDLTCIKDEKINYSASALKRRGRGDVTWFEIYGPAAPAENMWAGCGMAFEVRDCLKNFSAQRAI